MKCETRITKLTVTPLNGEIYVESATDVALEDDGGGEYVIVEQHNGAAAGKIAFNPEEWLAIRDAIDRMIKECREVK